MPLRKSQQHPIVSWFSLCKASCSQGISHS